MERTLYLSAASAYLGTREVDAPLSVSSQGCTRDTEAASWCCKRAYIQQAGWVRQLSQAPCGLANLNDFASSGAWGCL